MKKFLMIFAVALTIAAGSYLLSQSINSKGVTAQACQGSYYCQ